MIWIETSRNKGWEAKIIREYCTEIELNLLNGLKSHKILLKQKKEMVQIYIYIYIYFWVDMLRIVIVSLSGSSEIFFQVNMHWFVL